MRSKPYGIACLAAVTSQSLPLSIQILRHFLVSSHIQLVDMFSRLVGSGPLLNSGRGFVATSARHGANNPASTESNPDTGREENNALPKPEIDIVSDLICLWTVPVILSYPFVNHKILYVSLLGIDPGHGVCSWE